MKYIGISYLESSTLDPVNPHSSTSVKCCTTLTGPLPSPTINSGILRGSNFWSPNSGDPTK